MQIKTARCILSIVSLSGIQEAIRCNWQSFRKEYSLAPTIKTKAADSAYLQASYYRSIPIIMRYFRERGPPISRTFT